MQTRTSHVRPDRIVSIGKPRARLADVPEALQSRESVVRADRVITYELRVQGAASITAQQWAKATFEGASPIIRSFLVLGWRCVLGLRLSKGGATRSVLGWRLAEDLPNLAALEAASGLITGQNIAFVQDTSVFWITLVSYRRSFAAPIWRLVELVHRLVVPVLLTRAGRRRASLPGQLDQPPARV
jgi:hypothetical protein